MPFIEVGGVPVHYRWDGDAGKPPLVLLNSLGADLSMWSGQLQSFVGDFRVLRYDVWGHGLSDVTPGPYTIDGLVRDAVGLIEGLGVERADFCGLSMGGMVAMRLATTFPGLVGKLVLCNTGACIGTPDMWNARIRAVNEGGLAAIVPAVLERWFTRAFLERETAAVDRVRRMLLATSPQGYVACCAAIRDMDQRESVRSVQAKTLVISGTHDQVTPPAAGQFLAGQITHARYVELPAAHLSNVEMGESFANSVSQFLLE